MQLNPTEISDLIKKRIENFDAVAEARTEGKQVLAEITGYGSTLDAHSLSAPDPEGRGAARSMLAAFEDAGVEPERVSHINAPSSEAIPKKVRCRIVSAPRSRSAVGVLPRRLLWDSPVSSVTYAH